MSNLRTLLAQELHVPEELIKAYEGDKVANNAKDLLQKYQSGRFEFFKASDDFKTALTSERDKTFKGTQLSIIKKINSELELGFTNKQMEEFEDVSDLMTAVKANIEKAAKSEKTDEKTLAALDKAKEKASDYKKELDALKANMEKLTQETEHRIAEARNEGLAKTYYHNLVSNDAELQALNVPGKSFTLDNIRDRIFKEVKVGPDGKVTALDGSKFTHPEKDVVVEKVDELFAYYKEKAGLVKRSNAGIDTPAPVGATSTPSGGNGEPSAAAKQALAELQARRR